MQTSSSKLEAKTRASKMGGGRWRWSLDQLMAVEAQSPFLEFVPHTHALKLVTSRPRLHDAHMCAHS